MRGSRAGGWGPGTARAQIPGRAVNGHALVISRGCDERGVKKSGHPSHHYAECVCGASWIHKLGDVGAAKDLQEKFRAHALSSPR